MDLFRTIFHLPTIEAATIESVAPCGEDAPSASEAGWDSAKDELLRVIDEANAITLTNERRRGYEGAAGVLRRARRNAGQPISERIRL